MYVQMYLCECVCLCLCVLGEVKHFLEYGYNNFYCVDSQLS